MPFEVEGYEDGLPVRRVYKNIKHAKQLCDKLRQGDVFDLTRLKHVYGNTFNRMNQLETLSRDKEGSE